MLRITALLATLCIAANVWGQDGSPPLHASFDQDGVRVLEADQPVLVYQRTTKSREGKWSRSHYVHPLYGIDGKVITEDFPEDQLHHRGVFWAWHQVWVGETRMGDPWVCEDFVWDVQSVQVKSPASPLSIDTVTLWKSPLYRDDLGKMIPVVSEQTRITVHAAESSIRVIDFDISLLALVANVRIGGSENEKGYGGFSPRFKLTGDELFRSSVGQVEPTIMAIDAGPWIDISSRDSGVTMMSHADNPRPNQSEANQANDSNNVQPWILRRAHSMQNPVYPGRHATAISMHAPTRLRYRLVLHNGTLTTERINGVYRDYVGL